MKLVTFTHNNLTRVGAVINDTIIDSLGCPEIPDSMIKFLSAGPKALFAMQNLINKGNAVMALNEIKLNAPVPRPEKYLGISLNYADHIAETGREQPKYPSFLPNKAAVLLAVVMPFTNLKYPINSTMKANWLLLSANVVVMCL